MTITSIGSTGAVPLPQALGRAAAGSPRPARPATPAGDQVTLSAQSRAASEGAPVKAEAPVLHLSAAELRALVSPDSAKSPAGRALEQSAAPGTADREVTRAH